MNHMGVCEMEADRSELQFIVLITSLYGLSG